MKVKTENEIDGSKLGLEDKEIDQNHIRISLN